MVSTGVVKEPTFQTIVVKEKNKLYRQKAQERDLLSNAQFLLCSPLPFTFYL